MKMTYVGRYEGDYVFQIVVDAEEFNSDKTWTFNQKDIASQTASLVWLHGEREIKETGK